MVHQVVAVGQKNFQFPQRKMATSMYTLMFGNQSYLKELETIANSNPNDHAAQLKYLFELNKVDPEGAKKKFEASKMSVSTIDVATGSTAINTNATANTAMSNATTANVADSLNNASNTNPFMNANNKEPIQVMMVPSKAESRYRFLNFLVGLIGPSILLTLGYVWYTSTAEGQQGKDPFPVAPAHSIVTSVTERFKDVKGVDEAKADLVEVVEYLENPEKFTKLGARLPKGVLLYGEPGCGKTLLARAVAGEAGVPFFYVSGASFDEMFVGVGPRRVRDLFEEAKKKAPCIIFIDEIDAIGVSRKYNMNGGGSYAKESTLNQLLTEMDGFKQNEGIIVIGATNLPDSLDNALTRPGRFDKVVVVPSPDVNGRKQIIDLYLKKTKYDPAIDSHVIARGTTGFTGAEISNLINIAAIKAAINGKEHVDMKSIEEAKDDIIMGGKKRSLQRTQEDLKLTAYHEGGHTLVSMFSKHAVPVHKATIASRGSALGVTSFLPERDTYSQTRSELLTKLRTLMGGRAAEELIYGTDHVTSGASSDIKQASQIARSMVLKLGFSDKTGFVYHDQNTASFVSEAEKQLLDSEVKELLSRSYDEAKQILKSHERELHLLADALLEQETLSIEEIKQVISGNSGPVKHTYVPIVQHG